MGIQSALSELAKEKGVPTKNGKIGERDVKIFKEDTLKLRTSKMSDISIWNQVTSTKGTQVCG